MDIFKNVLKRKPELLSIKLFLYYFSRFYNLNIYTLVMVRNKNTQIYGFLKQNIHKWNQNRISSFKHGFQVLSTEFQVLSTDFKF